MCHRPRVDGIGMHRRGSLGEGAAAPPQPSSAWPTVLGLFTGAAFIEAIFWGQVLAFTPLYLPHLGVPLHDVPTWTGISVALSSAIGIPFLPLWGALADRYARRPVIIRSFVAHALAAIVMLSAANIWVFIFGRAIMSFSFGNSGLMMTTLSERVPRTRVGFAYSLMNSAAPVGAFAGPLFGGRVVDAWGFPTLLGVNCLLMLIVILSLAFGYRDEFQGTDREPLLRMAVDSLRIIWRSPRLSALFPALFVLFAGWMLANVYVPLAVTTLYRGGEPGTVVGFVLGAAGLVTLLVSPVLGTLADRFGHWRILFITVGAEILLWPFPARAHSVAQFALAWALLNGVASSAFALSFSVLASSAPDAARARVMSFAFLPVNLAVVAGPGLGSIVTKTNVFAVFPAAAAITVAGLVALILASRRPIARDARHE